MPPPFARRLLSVPAVLLGFPAALVLAPVLFVPAAVADVLPRPGFGRFRFVRYLALVYGCLAVEFAGLFGAASCWILDGFGLHAQSPRAQRRYHRLLAWYAGALLRVARATVGLRFEVEGDHVLDEDGPLVVLCRHASMGDAALPAELLVGRRGRPVRYTLKRELQWAPCIDIVGSRMRHHFVTRDNRHDPDQLGAIRRLAEDLDVREAAVIFPEGTYFTPARRERALDRIAASAPELAARARNLRHVLPPRPRGTLALLAGAPAADVVLITHVGLEAFNSPIAVFRNVPLRLPVRAKVERVQAVELPTEDAHLVDWLYERWRDMDRWVDAELTSRRDRGSAT